MKRKICKQCKLLYEENECPNCKSNQTANGYQGRVNVLDPKKSGIAQKAGIEAEGEFAIKVR